MANGLEGVSVRDQSETEITLDISNRGALIYRIAFTGIRRLKEEKEKKKKKDCSNRGINNCQKQLRPPTTGEQVCHLYRVAWQKGSRGLMLASLKETLPCSDL